MQVEKLSHHIGNIQNLLNNIQEDKISSIERDIILSELRTIYDEVLNVKVSKTPKKLNQEILPESEQNIVEKEQYPEDLEDPKNQEQEMIASEESVSLAVEEKNIELSEERPEIIEEEPKMEVREDEVEELSVEIEMDERNTETKKMEVFEDNETIVENEQSSAESSNEETTPIPKAGTMDLFSDNPRVEDKIKMNKINDLKKVIGINEKFQFINELFKGDIKAYTMAIEQLNQQDDKEQAQQLLNTMQSEYEWDAENETFEMISKLVSRRYL